MDRFPEVIYIITTIHSWRSVVRINEMVRGKQVARAPGCSSINGGFKKNCFLLQCTLRAPCALGERSRLWSPTAVIQRHHFTVTLQLPWEPRLPHLQTEAPAPSRGVLKIEGPSPVPSRVPGSSPSSCGSNDSRCLLITSCMPGTWLNILSRYFHYICLTDEELKLWQAK